MGNKDEELEICVQLQAYSHVGIMETGWDGSLSVREQLECIELCLGMDDEPSESLWVSTKEKTGKGDIVVGVRTGGKRKARGNVVPQLNDWAFSDAAQPDNTGHGKG